MQKPCTGFAVLQSLAATVLLAGSAGSTVAQMPPGEAAQVDVLQSDPRRPMAELSCITSNFPQQAPRLRLGDLVSPVGDDGGPASLKLHVIALTRLGKRWLGRLAEGRDLRLH